MTFPTGTSIETTNLASDASNPSLAREDLLSLVNAVNQLIASANSNSGVLVLNASGKIASAQMPGTINPTGNILLAPTGGGVSIENVLRLTQILTAELGTLTPTDAPQAGDLVYLTDGDAGNPCLGVYNGTEWRIVRFATSVGGATATISATATLSATADL